MAINDSDNPSQGDRRMRVQAYRTSFAVAAVVLSWFVSPASVEGGYLLENFESYDITGLPAGVVEGANYLSVGGDPSVHHIGPTWDRFGVPIDDGVFVSNRSDDVLSGNQSGVFFTDWGRGDWVSAVYRLDGMDVTTHSGYRIDIQSNGTTGQFGAGVIATFGGTVAGQRQAWISDVTLVAPQSITDSVQTYQFDFDAELFEEVNLNPDEADFTNTLSNLDWIGIRIQRQDAIGQESISVDNLILSPEPSSAVLLLGGIVIYSTRRRSYNSQRTQ